MARTGRASAGNPLQDFRGWRRISRYAETVVAIGLGYDIARIISLLKVGLPTVRALPSIIMLYIRHYLISVGPGRRPLPFRCMDTCICALGKRVPTFLRAFALGAVAPLYFKDVVI